MPEAMAPAPAAKAATMGRRLQQTAHDETVRPHTPAPHTLRPTPCARAGLALNMRIFGCETGADQLGRPLCLPSSTL